MAHVRGERVAAEQRHWIVGDRADQGDPLTRGERQDPGGVADYHDRFPGQPQRDVLAGRIVEAELVEAVGLGPPRRVKQAELGLLRQHPGQGPVDERLVDRSRAHLADQRLAQRLDRGQLDVDARPQCHPRRLGRARRDGVQGEEETDRVVVGDHRAREPPPLAQQAGQQVLIGGGGHAVDLRVGVHHRPRAAQPQCHRSGGSTTSARWRGPITAGARVAAAAGRVEYPAKRKLQRRATMPASSPCSQARGRTPRPRCRPGTGPRRDRLLGAAPAVVEGSRPPPGARALRAPRPPAWTGPIRPAISSTSSGSNAAPQLSGSAGYTVACQALKPVRHSSWTRAGIPNLLLATICACAAASERAPATGSTGFVPNGRVSCPRPCLMTSSNGWPSTMSAWCGAHALASEASAPTQTAYQLERAFSSSVSSGISAAARCAGREPCVSRQCVPLGRGVTGAFA